MLLIDCEGITFHLILWSDSDHVGHPGLRQGITMSLWAAWSHEHELGMNGFEKLLQLLHLRIISAKSAQNISLKMIFYTIPRDTTSCGHRETTKRVTPATVSGTVGASWYFKNNRNFGDIQFPMPYNAHIMESSPSFVLQASCIANRERVY